MTRLVSCSVHVYDHSSQQYIYAQTIEDHSVRYPPKVRGYISFYSLVLVFDLQKLQWQEAYPSQT